MRSLRVAMVQMNPTVGDLSGNVRRIQHWLREARKAKADLVVFPELALTGYPPEDLLLKPRFLAETRAALDEVVRACGRMAALVGFVSEGPGLRSGPEQTPAVARHALFNAAAIIADRRLLGRYEKRHLPNYGVFDENRYFQPGQEISLITLGRSCIGVTICEDIWFPEGPHRVEAAAGAEVIVNMSASPFQIGKSRFRERMLATRARDSDAIVAYVNMVGGQDELVFDGNSMILSHTGDVILRGRAFVEDLLVADLDTAGVARDRLTRGTRPPAPQTSVRRLALPAPARRRGRARIVPPEVAPLEPLEEVYRALVLGVRDYVAKNGFKRVLIGLSGGIDSALTAVIAVDAVGARNVLGVFMPSPYTSRESREDVAELVRRLGIDLRTIPITRIFQSYLRALEPVLVGHGPDETEENIQARVRGNLLMALSNKFGHLVLTTGNKSEMSVGYATLYGDMAGGFAVIKDVPKTMVFDLAEHRNRAGKHPPIPKRIFERPPSAELKPNQTDQDALPPYPVLDPILKAYVEEDRSPDDIVAMGFDARTVKRVIGMVDRSEYKRRQAPIGIKITQRALGKDRRMPITNGYRHV